MVRFTKEGFTRDHIIIDYITKVIISYQERLGKKICLVMDQAPSHCTAVVKEFLNDKKIHYLFIPAGATYLLQPLDVAVNKFLKDKVRGSYLEWLTKSVTDNKANLVHAPTIDNLLDWCRNSLDVLEPSLIFRAFEMTGFTESLESLLDRNTLSEKLMKIVDDFISLRETSMDDGDNYYYDAGDKAFEDIINEQELFVEEDDV